MDSNPSRASNDTASADSGCLSDALLVALVERRLSPEELSRLHHHAAGCPPCQDLLATVALDLDGQDPGGATPEGETYTRPGPVPADGAAPAEAPASAIPWAPPPEFDEFRLERVLGQGAMGIVHLAHDTSLDRSVAIKFIASSQPKPRVRAYFETEARAIARLQHPNVVTVFRVGEVAGRPYIVSEYIVGQSLAELPLPLPWRRVLTLGVGLARGLAAAHRQGVLHRDLKPSNALITRDGEVKLLDFGLAERFEPGLPARSPGPRVLAGTPRYMAPELLRGVPASPQSDIYALGLVLHELCTGQLPRQARAVPGSAEEASGGAARQDVSSLAARVSGIDPDFAAIIERCLLPDWTQRFGSAELLCEALERLERLHVSAPLDAGNPYRGLAPFEAEHRALFFGRDADIRALLDRLRSQPMVLVAADSGVGKSSLCRAGVLPRVCAGALDREFATVTLWPGRHPLEALAAALAPILGRKEAELATALAGAPGWLGRALREAHLGNRGLLLFVDQLEELVTLSDPEQAQRFASLLGELALPSPGVRVLLSVRGDFLTRVSTLPGLGNEAERALYLLRPISPEGVREAIVGPARTRGVVFESEELIQTLVAATVRGAGSLPLLQFALAELWERRDPARGCITRAALEEMGGVPGALSRHAEGVLARLDAAQQRAARSLFLRLVTTEGTRNERTEDELAAASDDARTALRALVEGRILHARTVGGQTSYQLAHDSLLESCALLRNWLDEDIGHRAVRQRVEAASAEWERLARSREPLWGKRQLDEATPLDPSVLGSRERAFLLASHRALTRQQWRRRLAVLLLPVTLALGYGGVRLQAYREDARFVTAQSTTARDALARGHDLGARARARREEALALFDGQEPASSLTGTAPAAPRGAGDTRTAAERKWAEALTLRGQADATYSRARQLLELALTRDHGRMDVHQLLGDITYERLLLAESFHPRGPLSDAVRGLQEQLEGEAWRQRLAIPAELELVTDPPGAHVELERYVDVEGVLRREPLPRPLPFGPTPITRALLPAGSYHLRLTHPGRVAVELPLLLTRGGREQLRLALPTTVPEGYVYVPPGCFLTGSDEPEAMRQGFLGSAPLHRFCHTDGYLIGRTEVTFGDWLKYLDTLPPSAPERRLLEERRPTDIGAVTLQPHRLARWIFSFSRTEKSLFTAWEGENLRYPQRTRNNSADWRRFPLTGVSAVDLEGYLAWLDRTGTLPGARLCNELEWERAARGADGRAYPHGDRLSPEDANIDATYGREPSSFGPDPVGTHPASMSPFGLHDMAGNAYELTVPTTLDLGSVVLRGGSWYFNFTSAHTASRSPGEPTQRGVELGVRLCASFQPR